MFGIRGILTDEHPQNPQVKSIKKGRPSCGFLLDSIPLGGACKTTHIRYRVHNPFCGTYNFLRGLQKQTHGSDHLPGQ